MASDPSVQTVESSEEFVHVRFRDPDGFDTIRTPDWASKAADSVVSGAEVRTGKRPGSDDWAVQSVLVPQSVGQADAKAAAKRIVAKIES